MSVSEQKSIVVSSDRKGFSMHLPPADPFMLGIGLSSYCWKISLKDYLDVSLSKENNFHQESTWCKWKEVCEQRDVMKESGEKNQWKKGMISPWSFAMIPCSKLQQSWL